MYIEIIKKYISSYEHELNLERVEKFNIVNITFLILTVFLLYFAKGFVAIALCLAAFTFVYLYYILVTKKTPTLNHIISSRIHSFFFIIFIFDNFLFAALIVLGNNRTLTIIILLMVALLELIGGFLGFYNTCTMIKKRKVKTKNYSAITGISATIGGSSFLFFKRFFHEASITSQVIVTTICVMICGSYFSYYLGKVYLFIYQAIKKCKIELE